MNKFITLAIVFLAGLMIAGYMNHNPDDYSGHYKKETKPAPFKYSGYETDDTNYYQGQILLPDLIHSDTLAVIFPELLNKMLQDPTISSDEELDEIIQECTIPLMDYEDYIKQLNN
jgi:hypothetical protein